MTTAALIAIGVQFGIEGASRLIAWRGTRGLPGKFGIPLTSLPAGLAFVVTAGLAVTDLSFVSVANPGVTSISAGSTLFLVGWFLRYPGMWDAHHDRTGAWNNVQKWIAGERWRGGSLAVRHQRYAGLCAEAVAIGVVAMSPIGLALGACTVLVVVACAKSEEDFAIAKWLGRGEKYWPYQVMSDPLLVRPSTWLWLIPAPILVALFVGFGTREFAIFSSDFDTARTLLLSFAGAQATALLFVFSALIVGMQLIGEAYSWRVVRPAILWRYRLLAGGALIVLSIGFDVLVVARASDWLTKSETTGALVDESMLLTVLAIGFLFWLALSMAGVLTAEAVVPVLLRRVSRRWMDWVDAEWERGYYVAHPRDPMLPVADLLSGVLRRGDVYGFRACIAALVDWKKKAWPRSESPASVRGVWDYPGQPGEEVEKTWPESKATKRSLAVDNYLHHHLAGLVRRAADDKDPSYIEGIHQFVTAAYRQAHPYFEPDWPVSLGEGMGERLLREIVASSLQCGHAATGASALHDVGFAAQRLVKSLPPLDETSLQYDLGEPRPERSKEQQERERHGDYKIDVLNDGYGGYLADKGTVAAARQLPELLDACLLSLEWIIREVVRADLSLKVQIVVIGSVAWNHSRVIDEAISSGCRIRYLSSPFKGAVFDLPDGDQGAELLSTLCSHEALFLRTLRKNGRIDDHIVDESLVVLSNAVWRNPAGTGIPELADQLRRASESLGTGDEPMSDRPRKDMQRRLTHVENIARRSQLSILVDSLSRIEEWGGPSG